MQPGKCRKRDFTSRRIQIVSRDIDQLISPPVESKCVRLPKIGPNNTFSRLLATYTMRPFKVRVPPKAHHGADSSPPLRHSRKPCGGEPETDRVMSGTVTVIATRAQYPYPTLAPAMAIAVPTIKPTVLITASAVKRISRCKQRPVLHSGCVEQEPCRQDNCDRNEARLILKRSNRRGHSHRNQPQVTAPTTRLIQNKVESCSSVTLER